MLKKQRCCRTVTFVEFRLKSVPALSQSLLEAVSYRGGGGATMA